MLNTQEMRKVVSFIVAPTIRMAEEADGAKLMRYVRQIADEPLNNTGMRHGLIPTTLGGYRDMIREHQERDNWVMFLADAEDQLAGMVRLTGGITPFDRHDAELHVNVHPDYRGMGIGSALIDQALQWAREHPTLRRIHLYVLTRNLGAIRLYQRHGFQVEGYMHDAYYLVEEGVYVDSLIMALSVK